MAGASGPLRPATPASRAAGPAAAPGSLGPAAAAGSLGPAAAAGSLGPAAAAGSLGPAAAAIRDRLAGEIAAGEPGPGERLGGERDLADRLSVSRATVRAALADLERTGVVRRARGRAGGIFVAARKVERDLTGLASLPAYLRRQGFQSDARVLSTTIAQADADASSALSLAPGELVHEIVRVRLADGEPISYERAAFPANMFPGLLDRSLGGSLYELLQSDYGLVPGEAEERIEVVDAGPAEARLLGVARGAPLVAIARTAWTRGGVAFERSHDLFRGDRVRIVVRARSVSDAPSVVAASVEVV